MYFRPHLVYPLCSVKIFGVDILIRLITIHDCVPTYCCVLTTISLPTKEMYYDVKACTKTPQSSPNNNRTELFKKD